MATRKPRVNKTPPPPKALPEYEAKRDFTVTPEPAPGVVTPSPVPTFMIHKHHASRLHYDLRLEMNAALASWAVPKGPSFDPTVKRLAVQTEDHPLEYGSFEGRIPDGEYGAGDSLIWDRGVYETVPPGQAAAQREKGHLHLVFQGEKLKGEWHLVRTRGGTGTKSNWILFKARDAFADKTRDIVSEEPQSVQSGRATTRGPERGQLKVTRDAPEALLEKVWPPMLATLVDAVPEPASEWLSELKYDGYRAICALSNGRVAMWTRNGLDLSERFSHLPQALAKIVVGDAVIDGEIVALDAQGVPRFQLLHDAAEDAILYAFDLLWLDGQDLRQRPLDERRDLLMSLLSRVPAQVRVAERVPGEPGVALQEVASRGWEGLILKHRGSPYVGMRSREWLKLKAHKEQELAIVGYTRSNANDALIGALLVAVVIDGELRFAGKVGTGFSNALRAELMQRLAADAVAAPRVAGAPRMRAATWVEPRLVAQVEFTEWTADGKLRHPSFVGLRDDKSPMECTVEMPSSPSDGKKKRAGKSGARGEQRADADAGDGATRGATKRGAGSRGKTKRGVTGGAVDGGGGTGNSAAESHAAGSRAAENRAAGSRAADDRAADNRAGEAAGAGAASGRTGQSGGRADRGDSDAAGALSTAAAQAEAPVTVELTNPQRIIFPRDHITKTDMAAYFQAVSEPMLRALKDRPLALQHWPKGIDGPTWFHQHIGKDAPSWLRTVETPNRTDGRNVKHLIVHRPESLRFLAQRSALTVHMWASHVPTLDQPDWVIFDLDPAEGQGIAQAVRVAHALHRLLEELSLPSVPKTTGKRGLHILVPLLPGHTHNDAVEFAEKIGGAIMSALPETTMERALAKRNGRLYIDCYQNGYGKTIVAPYSPRAGDGAPVSTPLKWSEVSAELDPRAFNVRTVPDRVRALGDLFLPALEAGVRLPRLR